MLERTRSLELGVWGGLRGVMELQWALESRNTRGVMGMQEQTSRAWTEILGVLLGRWRTYG